MNQEGAPEAVPAASTSGHVTADAASTPGRVPRRMSYPGAVAGVLRREGLDDPTFLGAGEDAWAFALSDTEAIRVFPHASKRFVSELVHLYDRLQGHPFSFQCPRIHEVRVHEGIVYTIEARLPGRPMGEFCREADGEARRRVLRNYLEAVRELGEVEIGDREFGGLSCLSGLAHGRDLEGVPPPGAGGVVAEDRAGADGRVRRSSLGSSRGSKS